MPKLKPTALLTGSTAIQVGSERTQLKIMTSMRAWKSALEAMGYTVDWRSVVPGEDVSSYRVVMASLNQPNALVSVHVHGVLWCMLSRPDCVVILDDWQVYQITNGLRTWSRSQERMFRLRNQGISTHLKDQLHEYVIEILSTNGWSHLLIAPILGNGDLSLLRAPGKTIGVDPTSFSPRMCLTTDNIKKRGWTRASLLKKDDDDVNKWPVEYYGWRDSASGGGNKKDSQGQPRVEESELFKIYQESWGVLSPPHPHAGSGWWRYRYLMSVDAGCVLSADIKEATCLGRPYIKASDITWVESLSDSGLIKLATDQARCLEEITWSKERVIVELRSVIDCAKSRR